MLNGVTPWRDSIPGVLWTRLNEHYRPAVELATLVLNGTEVDQRAGQVRAASLVIDMATVFEDFVRVSMRRVLGASPVAFPDGNRTSVHLDVARQVRLEPDLSWWREGRCVFGGELKYRHDSGRGQAKHLQQLLAYVTALGLQHGTLVYADGPPVARIHRLHDGRQLHLRHLHLDRPPTDILAQIDELAAHVRRCAAEEPSSVTSFGDMRGRPE
jgi:5-methylcytosine-specific restriction enzyme subunit McrC